MIINHTLYQALLHLYPPGFRAEFGDEMALDFEDSAEDVWQTRGWAGILSLWITIGADVARTSLLQWLRTGLPALFVVSAAWSTLVFGMIGIQFIPLQQRLRPSLFITPGEAVVLIVMAVAAIPVLVVMAAGWLPRRRPRPEGDADARSSAAH